MGQLTDQVKIEPAHLVGAAVGMVASVWVGLDVFVRALLVLMLADVLTGLIAAGIAGDISSAASRRGLGRKAVTLIVVLVVGWLSANLGDHLGASFPGGQAVAASCCLTELISMLENARRAGMQLGPLDRVLAAARGVQPPSPPSTGPVRG